MVAPVLAADRCQEENQVDEFAALQLNITRGFAARAGGLDALLAQQNAAQDDPSSADEVEPVVHEPKGIGPPWTRGKMEWPKDRIQISTWIAAVFSPEQQKR